VALREYRANKYQLLKVVEPKLQEIILLLIEIRYSHVITLIPTVAYRCLQVPTGAYTRLGMILRPSLFNI
jgi:hypothetical protein